LPEIFAQFVDMTAKVAPEALDKLAGMSARRRRFVARNPEAIHPGNRHLPITRTASGWWISKNIGQEDLKRALRALCDAAGLTFGADVKFLGAVKRRAAWERRNGLGNNDVTAQPHPA